MLPVANQQLTVGYSPSRTRIEIMFYRGFHFTKHALERLDLRSISKDDVINVLQKPAQTFNTDKPGTVKFIKDIQDRTIHVVATHLAKDDSWLVISVWVRGEEDRQPFLWQILSLPFKLAWWLLRAIGKAALQQRKK